MKKIIDGQIVDTKKMSLEELEELRNELNKKEKELRVIKNRNGIELNIKLFATVITDWLEVISNLMTIDAAIFVKWGEAEILQKIQDTEKALESRGIEYGLSYQDIVKKYNLDSEKEGNLLGNYRISLVNLNNIYKKAYKSILDVKTDTLKELKTTYKFIIKLQKEKMQLYNSYADYMEYEKRIQELGEEAKKAIKEGDQKKALEISNEILIEKQNNPLQEYEDKFNILDNQTNIYEEVLLDCQKQLDNYYKERKDKFEKTIIVEPIESKVLVVRKKKFWEFWKK